MKKLIFAAGALACLIAHAQSPVIGALASGSSVGVVGGSCAAGFVAVGITSSGAPICAVASGAAFSGGTVTTPITLPADPTTALQAATKQYVDKSIAALPSGLSGPFNLTASGCVVPSSAGSTYPVQSCWNYTTLFDAATGYNDYSYGLTVTHKVNSGSRDYAEAAGGQGNDASALNIQSEYSSPMQGGGLFQLEHTSHGTGDVVAETKNILGAGEDRGTNEGLEPHRDIYAFEHAVFGGTIALKGTDSFGRLQMQVTATQNYTLASSGEDRLLIDASKKQILPGTGTIGTYSDTRFSTVTMDATLTASMKAAIGCAGATCAGGETTLTSGADTTIQSGCPATVTGNYNTSGTNPYLTDYAGNGSQMTARCLQVPSTAGMVAGKPTCIWSGLNDWECQKATTVVDGTHIIMPLQSVHDAGSLVTWGDGAGYGISTQLSEMPAGYLSSLQNPQNQIERIVYPIVRVNGSTVEVFTNADVNGNQSELRLIGSISSSASPANALTIFPLGKIYHLLDPSVYTSTLTTHNAHTGYVVVDAAIPSLFASGDTVEQTPHWQQYSIDQHIIQQSPYVALGSSRTGPWSVLANEYPQFEQIQHYFANPTRSSLYAGTPTAADPLAGRGGRPVALGFGTGHAIFGDMAYPEGSTNINAGLFRVRCVVRGQDGKDMNPPCLAGDYQFNIVELDSSAHGRFDLYYNGSTGYGNEGGWDHQTYLTAANKNFQVDGSSGLITEKEFAQGQVGVADLNHVLQPTTVPVFHGGILTVGTPYTYTFTETVSSASCTLSNRNPDLFGYSYSLASNVLTITATGTNGDVLDYHCYAQ